MDTLELMDWTRQECERRGLSEPGAVMRKMSDAADKRRRMSTKDVQREIIEELRLMGHYLAGEQTFEERVAAAEALKPTTLRRGVDVFRSGGGPKDG
jgi:hypothetical protein